MSRRKAVIVLLCALCPALLLATPPASGGAALQPRLKGKLPVMGPPDRSRGGRDWHTAADHQIFLDPVQRRGYQFFLISNTSDGAFAFVQGFDADSLLPVGSARLHANRAVVLVTRVGKDREDYLHAQDEQRGVIYVAVRYDAGQGPRQAVMVVDLRRIGSGGRGQQATPVFLLPANATDPGTEIVGLTLVKASPDDLGKLLVLYGPRQRVGFTLQRWDLATAQRTPNGFAVEWGATGNLRACTGTTAIPGPLMYSAKRNTVYGVCSLSTSLTDQGQFVPAVFRVTDPESADSRQEVFVGPRKNVGRILPDPAGERLFLGVNDGGETVWGFDGPKGRFVGIAGIGPAENRALGIDPANGRVYALTPNQQASPDVVLPGGLFAVDGRLTPVPQALRYPEFHGVTQGLSIRVLSATEGKPALVFARRAMQWEADGQNTCDPNVGRQQCDNVGINHEPEYPGTGHRVIVPDDLYWMVIEDPVLVTRQPVPDDLDRLTVDVPEQPGVTDASFEGVGSAYAFRARLIGGLLPYSEGQCVPDDREIVLGTVQEARLTTFEAAARVSGIAFNEALAQDLVEPATRCDRLPGSNEGGTRIFPQTNNDNVERQYAGGQKAADARLSEPSREARAARPAECTDDGEAAGGPVSFAGGKASGKATCRRSQETVRAEANMRWSQPAALGSYDLGTISVASAESAVTASRQPGAGVVIEASAVVRGVEIPLGTATAELMKSAPAGARTNLDAIRISVARSEARVWSNGRPSAGSRATLRRAVCGVSGPGLPEGPGTCATDDAQLRALVDRINVVLNESRSGWRVYLPEPDPDLARGSRLGYVSGIQKPAPDRVDDQLINGDFSYEVPALDIRRIADSPQYRRRQIYSLAAVRASATYGLSLLAEGRPLVDDGSLDDVGALPFDPSSPTTAVLSTGIGADDFRAGPGARPLVAIEALGNRIFGLLTRPVKETGLASAVWLLLALPFFLAWRRGALSQSAPRG